MTFSNLYLLIAVMLPHFLQVHEEGVGMIPQLILHLGHLLYSPNNDDLWPETIGGIYA